jgi:hypothetical protein
VTAARRTGDAERMGERPVPVEAAPALERPEPARSEAETEPDLSKPAAAANPATGGTVADSVTAEDAETPVQAPRVETARNDPPEPSEPAAGQQFAALEPPAPEGGPSAADGGARAPPCECAAPAAAAGLFWLSKAGPPAPPEAPRGGGRGA